MRLLLIGYGRMGRLVDALAADYGGDVVGRLDSRSNPGGAALSAGAWRGVDVAIDFSTAAAVRDNLPRLATLGINAVVGTTGWKDDEPRLRAQVEHAIGVVAAANFSAGVTLFEALVAYAGGLLASQEEWGAWLHELHHARKRDAPSGTALMLTRALERAGYTRTLDVSSTRAGSIPGTHTVGFDAPYETITLTHTARDRATFAHGALAAARWVHGQRGWFDMQDVLGLRPGREDAHA